MKYPRTLGKGGPVVGAVGYGNGRNETITGRALAGELGITPAQLSLAWLLHQGNDIVPIPGTRKAERVLENAGAADVALSPETVEQVSRLASAGLAVGRTLL